VFRFREVARVLLVLAFAVVCFALVSGCGAKKSREVRLYLDEPFPKKLSAWNLFRETHGGLKPNDRALPYDLNTPLFSDYASKHRFVWMPRGKSAEYREDGVFEFPVGTIFAKCFAFPVDGKPGQERLIETRLLVRTRAAWIPLPYVWNAEQTEATLQIVPDPVPVHFSDAAGQVRDFTYQIPNTNECHECHDNNKVLLPIGPKARNLNKTYDYADGNENQLEHWQQTGYLRGLAAAEARPKAAVWSEPSTGSLDGRARAYLDSNCAHCHQPGGQAGYTGVDFRLGQNALAALGACKRPNSAGDTGHLRYDVVPGAPSESVLIYRLESTAPKISMPQIGRAVVHEEGVKLLREWIASLPGGCG
jgi:uncharacterized repeat protein (TIGR03806 family)